MRWPGLDTMATRVLVLLVAGIVGAAVLAFAISGLQVRAAADAGREQRLVDRIADAAAVLAAAPDHARPDVLGVGPEALRLAPTTGGDLGPDDAVLSARVDRRLDALAVARVSEPQDGPCLTPAGPGAPAPPPPPPTPPPTPTPTPGADGAPPPDQDRGAHGLATPPPPPILTGCRRVRLSFPGGESLELVAPLGPRPPVPALPFGPAPLIAMVALAAGVAWAVAGVTVAPLTRLGEAARALGRDLDRPPLDAAAGPREVREAALAFNTMQARLRREMEERTHMLAAITHDLQTPLTRQRLRLEKIADPELRAHLLADQEAMRGLIREGLDLARASHNGEDAVKLEIDSLLDSLAADATAVGQDVQVVGQHPGAVRTRPQAIARCLTNLIDNALKYAGAVELSAEADGDGGVVVRVLDRGPGLTAGELESLFEPFRRGEASRSRETGGAGLGLTIARLLAERSGARLSLNNRPGGGLEARLAFAASDPPGPDPRRRV